MRGVCTRPFLIGKPGDFLYKALKKRRVSGAVLLGTVVYLGNRAFDLDFKGLHIALLTPVAAAAGFAAQRWGRWVLARSLNFAESRGANLLEPDGIRDPGGARVWSTMTPEALRVA